MVRVKCTRGECRWQGFAYRRRLEGQNIDEIGCPRCGRRSLAVVGEPLELWDAIRVKAEPMTDRQWAELKMDIYSELGKGGQREKTA